MKKIFNYFRRLFYRVPEAFTVSEAEPESLTMHFRQSHKCPDCGKIDWLGGPKGGICQNFMCNGCGSEFNLAIHDGMVITAERI